jgi:hypothetical protein
MDFSLDEGKFIEKERIIKFYISQKSECHVEVNDTIIYENSKLRSPIEHVVIAENDKHNYKISPKGVYSGNVNIEYFGFSKGIKTFSTYFQKKENASLVNMEYIYDVRNLIKSFSDFRDEASYQNITYNYNLISWHFQNQNENKEDLKIKIEYYFDIGDKFMNEMTNFSIPMKKSNFTIASQDSQNLDYIVKFETENEIILHFNETLTQLVRFPLYFENCKNYKLNTFVVITGFIFIAFFFFVIWRTIIIIFYEEKE